MIACPTGCAARMHQCKREDHHYICPNVFVSCTNAVYGCPSTMKREQINEHLSSCPASVVICQFTHMYQSHSNEPTANEDSLLNVLARRDNIWYNYTKEVEKRREASLALLNQAKLKNHPVEHLIRSERYRYITMPECMLSKGDGVICSTCRKHLRQLEENEDQRLSEATEGTHSLTSEMRDTVAFDCRRAQSNGASESRYVEHSRVQHCSIVGENVPDSDLSTRCSRTAFLY